MRVLRAWVHSAEMAKLDPRLIWGSPMLYVLYAGDWVNSTTLEKECPRTKVLNDRHDGQAHGAIFVDGRCEMKV